MEETFPEFQVLHIIVLNAEQVMVLVYQRERKRRMNKVTGWCKRKRNANWCKTGEVLWQKIRFEPGLERLKSSGRCVAGENYFWQR